MTPYEADELSDRMSKTWTRSAIPAGMWAEVFAGLGHAAAEAAYRELRDNEIHTPSIALFLSTYRGQISHHAAPRVDCDRCDGTGLISVDRARNMVGACNCRAGADGRATLDRCNAGNDAEPALAHSRRMGRAGVGPPPRKEPLL